MFLPHFGVLCGLFLDRRTAAWNIFVLKSKESNYMTKTLVLERRAFSPFPTLTNTKMVIESNLLPIQNAAISLLSMHSKEF